VVPRTHGRQGITGSPHGCVEKRRAVVPRGSSSWRRRMHLPPRPAVRLSTVPAVKLDQSRPPTFSFVVNWESFSTNMAQSPSPRQKVLSRMPLE